MAFWQIGPIRGNYQPEDFSETQETLVGDHKSVGGVQQFQFKHWSAREITISFAVDYYDSAGLSESDQNACDPEAVWDTIQNLQRPRNGLFPTLVDVLIPGWGNPNYDKKDIGGYFATDANGNETSFQGKDAAGGARYGSRPTRAVIISSSIKRTHIRWGNPQASRAIITVKLREFAAVGIVRFFFG